MKRVLLFSALFLVGTFAANAQEINKPQTAANVGMAPIQQGNWMVGGSLGSLGYSFEGENFNIRVEPRAGYFISDGVAIGLGLLGSLYTAPESDAVWGYGVAPFVRYYFPEGASSTGRFFAQGDVGISGSSPGSGASLALGANVGYAHFVTNSVALEVTAGYNYSKATVSGSTGQNGLGVALGFQIYLPGQR
ncbi:hypothetical protein SAMN05421747_11316 [Parapedobacter composti]|uniref:Outer membrane protein beta-barrel domain-containing protein n=1 Tax=Parapedobacter composti TaxID=623281 RepID=A0A1I1JRM3_9SPHI|nr:hypothetical protein [Parapedobacter composti]SFC51299.1 hypothetical protein SAMN05421747_11316 [Parapedobacter composti]